MRRIALPQMHAAFSGPMGLGGIRRAVQGGQAWALKKATLGERMTVTKKQSQQSSPWVPDQEQSSIALLSRFRHVLPSWVRAVHQSLPSLEVQKEVEDESEEEASSPNDQAYRTLRLNEIEGMEAGKLNPYPYSFNATITAPEFNDKVCARAHTALLFLHRYLCFSPFTQFT